MTGPTTHSGDLGHGNDISNSHLSIPPIVWPTLPPSPYILLTTATWSASMNYILQMGTTRPRREKQPSN